MRAVLLVTLALLAAGCTRGDQAAKHRLFAREGDGDAAKAFDPAHPESALSLTADDAAGRLGSFEWAGAVEWSVGRGSGPIVHVTEKHQVRQLAGGEFEVRADVDPGLGPSAVQGKEILYVNGMTYARALPASFRERPTDRGQDARRFREDSFGLVRTVAAMVGSALRIEADGGQVVLGRETHHYRFSLGAGSPTPSPPVPAGFQAKDPDTALRQGFLSSAVARSVEGELAIDAATGVPLSARLSATFDGPPDKRGAAQVSVTVSAQMKAFGGEVKALAPPAGALPDERKPAGPSSALEDAGLKKRGEEGRPSAEPADEVE
jgi:hypothetical protein